MKNLTAMEMLQMEIEKQAAETAELEKAYWATAKSNELPRNNTKAHVEYLKAQYSLNGLYTAKSIMEKVITDTSLETVNTKYVVHAAKKSTMYTCCNAQMHDNEDTALLEAVKEYGTEAVIIIKTVEYKALKGAK